MFHPPWCYGRTEHAKEVERDGYVVLIHIYWLRWLLGRAAGKRFWPFPTIAAASSATILRHHSYCVPSPSACLRKSCASHAACTVAIRSQSSRDE